MSSGAVEDLLIDATGLGPGTSNTGTGRILEELVPAMLAVRPGARITVAGTARALVGSAQDKVRWIDDLSGPKLPEVLFRPRQLLANRELAEVMRPGRRVVLYQLDTIAVTHDYFPSVRQGQFVRNVVRAALRSADVVATLSQSARSDIEAFCPDIEPRRLVIVPCGATVIPGTPIEPTQQLKEPFCLVLSASFEHKNRPFALRVFSEMVRRGYSGSLVIAGPEPVYGSTVFVEDELIRSLSERVVRLGPVSDGEKWWLLAHAQAVLYPSTTEGFGLVPFEAASVHTPALMSDVSCFREVCGVQTELVEGFDAERWADTLMRWSSDPATGGAQVAALRARGEELTWQRAAVSAWQAIDLAASLPAKRPEDWEGGWANRPLDNRVGLAPAARAVQQVYRAKAVGARLVGQVVGSRRAPRGY